MPTVDELWQGASQLKNESDRTLGILQKERDDLIKQSQEGANSLKAAEEGARKNQVQGMGIFADAQRPQQYGDVTKIRQQQDQFTKDIAAHDAAITGENERLKTRQGDMDKYQGELNELKPFRDLQQQQATRAGQFRMAFPSVIDNQMSQFRQQSRQDVAQGVNQARSSYNSRGLLNSGLRQGTEQDMSRVANQGLVSKNAELNSQFNDEANQLDQDAIDTGNQVAGLSSNFADTNNQYRQALLQSIMDRSRSQDQAVGSIFSGGAGILGSAVGGMLTPGKDKDATKKKEA